MHDQSIRSRCTPAIQKQHNGQHCFTTYMSMYRLCGSQRQGAFIPLHLDDRPWRCAALHVDRALAPVAGAGGRSFSGIVVSQPVLGNSFRGCRTGAVCGTGRDVLPARLFGIGRDGVRRGMGLAIRAQIVPRGLSAYHHRPFASALPFTNSLRIAFSLFFTFAALASPMRSISLWPADSDSSSGSANL